jgi:hypothetical protein
MSAHAQNRIRGTMHDVTHSSEEFVAEHPMSATLAAFGLGLGVGVALVFLLTEGAQQRHDVGLSHRLGRVVLDAIGRAVPESLSNLRR